MIITSVIFFAISVIAVTISGFVYGDSGVTQSKSSMTNGLGNSWYSNTAKRWYKGHMGEDYSLDRGENIYAIANGRVVKVYDWPLCTGRDQDAYKNGEITKEEYNEKVKSTHGWGKVVIVEHKIPDDKNVYFNIGNDDENNKVKIVYSQYGHLGSIKIKEGDNVEKSQVIGNVGDMRCLWGDHLHLEIKKQEGYDADLQNTAGAGTGYSGTDGSAPHRYAPSKFIELNKDLVVGEPETSVVSQSESRSQSLFSRFYGFVASIWGRFFGSQEAGTEAETVVGSGQVSEMNLGQAEQPIEQPREELTPPSTRYDAQILNSGETVTVARGAVEMSIVLRAKNTGTTPWTPEEISVNVVGGEAANQVYRHASWLTALRPAKLDQTSVAPGGAGTFSARIALPPTPGSYTFRLQIVRQADRQFVQVGSAFFVLTIVVTDVLSSSLTPATTAPPQAVAPPSLTDQAREMVRRVGEEARQLGGEIKDMVNRAVEPIFILFSGPAGGSGSGGGSSSGTTESDQRSMINEQPTINAEPPVIALTSPSSSLIYVNTPITTIAGTKNETVTAIWVNGAEAAAVFSSSTVWETAVSLIEGANRFEVSGQSAAGRSTATTSLEIFLDTIPPAAPSLALTQTDFTSATPTIDVAWESTDSGSGILGYDLEMAMEDGEGSLAGLGAWHGAEKRGTRLLASSVETFFPLLSRATSTRHSFAALRLKRYRFRARAIDAAGNVSVWSDSSGNRHEIISDWRKNVVINEAAWMGTGGGECAKHEWIELKNNTAALVDLSGWRLFVGNASISLSGVIEPDGYYLLVRRFARKDALTGLPINLTTESLDIPDAGARFALVNSQGETVDEVSFISGWSAGRTDAGGDGARRQPMARKDPSLPGSFRSNWETADRLTPFGRTNNCGELYGSPGRANRGFTLLRVLSFYYSDWFSSANTLRLTKEQSPYILDYITEIPNGMTLEIDPGVTIIGIDRSSALKVLGLLKINGTAEEPVVFTSARAFGFGLPLSGMSVYSPSSTPAAGDWSRIEIKNGGRAEIKNTRFRYGGYFFEKGTGWVYGMREIAQVIRIVGSTAVIEDTVFENNYQHTRDKEYNAVIWADISDGNRSALALSRVQILGGWLGVGLDSAGRAGFLSADLNNVQFKNLMNPDGPLYSHEVAPSFTGLLLEGNAADQLSLINTTFASSTTLAGPYPYRFSGITVPSGSTLTLDPGVVLRIAGHMNIEVRGTFKSRGAANAPVTIVNGSGYAWWGSLVVRPGGTVDLAYTRLKNGNRGDLPLNDSAMLWADQATVFLDQVTFEDAYRSNAMIQLHQSDMAIKNSLIRWSVPKTVSRTVKGIALDRGSLAIDNTRFEEMDIGIEAVGAPMVTAQNLTPEHFIRIAHSTWWPRNLLTFETASSTASSTEGI